MTFSQRIIEEQLDCSRIDANDWMYIAEGGEHAIFAYKPRKDGDDGTTKDVSKDFVGKILRIRKKDLCQAVNDWEEQSNHIHGIYDDNDGEKEEDNELFLRSINVPSHDNFQASFVYSVMKAYIDRPIPIELPFRFVKQVYHNTTQQDKEKSIIPSSRKKDWDVNHKKMHMIEDSVNKNGEDRTIHHSILASIQPNYRDCRHGDDDKIPSLTIEIKPKAGYLPYSPLIHPNNRAKYFHSRFEILQQLYVRQIIDKGWSTPSGERIKSYYNPLDLFSGKSERIRHAMKSLLECPQNNLKVYYSDVLLYGNSDVTGEDHDDNCLMETKRILLENVFQVKQRELPCENVNSNIDEILQSNFQEMISIIFLDQRHKDFLTTLQTLQSKLDLLDYDGVIIVYRRLIELCHGSDEEAETFVDTMKFHLMDKLKKINSSSSVLMNGSLYDLHSSNLCNESRNRITSYLSICEEVQEYIAQEANDVVQTKDFSKKMDQLYEDALDCVKHFDKNECIALLQYWLISLMMCDVSFIISITPIAESNERRKMLSLEHQSFCFNDKMFDVQIRLVDLDGKPATKLRNRLKLERKIGLFISPKNNSI